ncbi:hypothetical protein Tel_01600 [Candidatus Tenderia electrophaga]|jgi:hypothetical protein|uniref:Cellulose synthase operon C C-terminal domain-containing protein n=1 Tax=Candidatus Tenderia electrophaga TaxID=1748243 RepID=A0A0S2T9V2_9GAMM|nr:hypothetical protein Tel_01600 [Candidatus Tenderia electrophaga]
MTDVVTSARMQAPWLRICGIAFALLLCAPLATAADSNASVFALRAKLYVQVGDYYASRQENQKAANAYRQAAELAKVYLPPATQTDISRRLANVNDITPAIGNLQSQCDGRQNTRESCLLLARYLSWNNQPIAASKVGRELLQHEDSNKEVLITQANALSWQGDDAGALGLYQQVASTDNSFDIKLSYARSLLATANYEAARTARSQLRAESEFEQSVIDDLDWQMRREARPRVWLSSEQYRDVYHAGYRRSYLGVDIPFATSWLWFRTGRISSSDGLRDVEVTHHSLGGLMRLHDRAQLRASIGRASHPADLIDPVTTGNISITANLPQTWLVLNATRELVDDSPRALETSVLRTSHELALSYQFSDRWGLRLQGKHTDYSDDNQSLEAKLAGLYTFYFGPPKMSVGLKREALSFDRQSGGGYFDPDRVTTNKLLFVISQSQDRFSGVLELFAGNQTIDRFGTVQENNIAGGYTALRYQLIEHAQLELTLEGANLGLGEAKAYRYNQTKLKVYVYF